MDQGSRITNRGPDSAPRAQNRRTNCAVLRNNSFVCHTCAFHGGGVGVG
jgi:hypothetical protein